jgi:DNA-binding PucR family transcriptional regulator
VVLLVESDADDLADVLAGLIADGGDDPVLGAGRPLDEADPAALRQALAEAITALALARSRPPEQRVVRHLDIGSHVLLLDFVDRQVLHSFRESVLGPLERWDGVDLIHTLQAFLANDGQWRVTAAHLGIHHNTLRYRISRIAGLTGRDVETTAGRVDFALALAIGERRPRGPGSLAGVRPGGETG